MSRAENALQKLDKATRRWHNAADEPWLSLLRPDVSEREYCDHLVRVYGFEAPLEGACAYTPQLSRVIELRHLRRAGLIAQDLLALGMSPSAMASLPQCFSITPFTDVSEALGWLYVVERTTLLHDRIRRHLHQHLPDFGYASHYLRMFDHVPDHWQRFGKTLDRAANRPELLEDVIEGAHAGFECMQRWFQSMGTRLRSTA